MRKVQQGSHYRYIFNVPALISVDYYSRTTYYYTSDPVFNG